MAKKNLPYLPLYTGDWIKDCNVLSLEAEAAWLRIIFKMFNGGKQSTYKVPTKALQNLWRVSEEKVLCIIEELQDNDICGIKREDRYITFTSRRYEKENRISEIRKEAVSKRKDRTNPDADGLTKDLQNAYKTDTKHVQTTEIEIENNNNIDNNNKTTKKKNSSSNTRGEKSFDYSGMDESFIPAIKMWLEYKKGRGQTYKTQKSFELMCEQLIQLSRGDPKTAMLIVKQSMANNWAGLFELKTNNGSNGKNIGSKVHEVVTDPATGDFSDDI